MQPTCPASRYGITRSQLAAMRARVTRCEICAAEGRLVIDHDHRTGRVRGLLCQNCNSAIGKLREDPELFANALNYLERHRG
nr:endonuclease VII domain-containing protein [Novosphingobium piscinae]